MKMKIKGKEVFSIIKGLKIVGELTESTGKFAYGVSKNRKILQKESESILDIKAHSDEYKEYDLERTKIVESNAVKDDKGNSIKKILDKDENIFTYQFKDEEETERLVDELSNSKKWKKVVDDQREKEKAFINMLNSTINIDVHKIDSCRVPKNITGDQRFAIIDLIKE